MEETYDVTTKIAGQPDSSVDVSDMSSAWHTVTAEKAAIQLDTSLQQGLSFAEAVARLQHYGPNTLRTTGQTPWYRVLARQFTDVLIFILLLAAAISLLLGETIDAITILLIVVLNGTLGFIQEWRAERAIEALQQMLSPQSTVWRDGQAQTIAAEMLVPGDVIMLEMGDRVPADLRLIESLDLKLDESSLTGESIPVSKRITLDPAETPLAERRSMAWMGTAVTNGRGRGVVVATGMQTEFGRIAQLTQQVGQEMTPLQRKLAALGKQLGIFSIVISIIVATAGWLMGKPLLDMFLTGVSLAVAVVPEGLPAVVTLTLALGIRAMVKRKALLRRLQAAETLGAATVICTDKTGTLTQNEMTVQHIWLPAGSVQVTGVGYDPAGHFEEGGNKLDYNQRSDLKTLLETGIRCNNAHIYKDDHGWHQIGDPTEAALMVVAYKAWLHPNGASKPIGEFSFNSRRKRMTVIEQAPHGTVAHVKGAPEVILQYCTHILDGDLTRAMTETDKDTACKAYQNLAKQGLRTLALARRNLPDNITLDEDLVENNLTLLGIVGMIDPPRPEVPEAIRLAHTAGIRVIIITGDAPETATAIAKRVGLTVTQTLTGTNLSAMADKDLQTVLTEPALFARTTPEHKLRLVRLLQDMGEIVGMTSDGVNDAPALKQANIGIAMGLRGTEVARSAAEMILTDDNFASIIGAIEEGRRQYDNIQKFVRYLLGSNTAEIIAILVNILIGGPLILLPVQILWMNLVTDGVTAVALGLEPAEKGVMKRPPRSTSASILDREGVLTILAIGSYMGLATLWLFHYYLSSGQANAGAIAQTVAFSGLILLEKMNVFNFRALREPLSVIGFFSNPWVLLAWASMIGLQVAAVYIPLLQNALHTVPLGWADWGLMLLVAAPVFIIAETTKWWRWRIGQAEDT